MYVADDPGVSDRLRQFLADRSHRHAHMDDSDILLNAALDVGGQRTAAPDDLVAAMVQFERRYGGLRYGALGGNDMDYGLDDDPTGHQTPFGPAFTAIADGDWTWDVDVLVDGRTAMQPGAWPYRLIDRSVDQRLEKHALLVSVHQWSHQTAAYATTTGTVPHIDDTLLPPHVPEATGPTDVWYAGRDVAVEITLSGWPPDKDMWTVRCFARTPDLLSNAALAELVTGGGEGVTPAWWCDLCSRHLAPGEVCVPPVRTGPQRLRLVRWIRRRTRRRLDG